MKDPHKGNGVDWLGGSTAIDGDTLVAGAPYSNLPNLNGAGLVRVYRNDGFGNWTLEQELTAPDAASFDMFGYSVGVSGDTMVVGALEGNHERKESGSAYVFTRSNGVWRLQQKIVAPDAAELDFFGRSVAICGETLVVGAPGTSNPGVRLGSAYVFTRTGTKWGFQAKLVASDADPWNSFGQSVALSKDTIAVGSPEHTAGQLEEAGSVYVFVRANGTWTQQATLIPSDAAENDRFGTSVAISGDTVVGGAYLDDDGGTDASYNSGSAYVFTRSNGLWAQQAKLNAPDPVQDDFFGWSVAISGDSAVIGALESGKGDHRGAAYIFTRVGNEWDLKTTLTGATFDPHGHSFGYSVAIDEDTAVVGYPFSGNSENGSVFLFSRLFTRWSPEADLAVYDSTAYDSFGASVAIDGGTAVVTATGDDDRGRDAGAAYVFEHAGAGWEQKAKLTAFDTTAGDTFGHSVAVSGDTVVVGATGDNFAGDCTGSAAVFTRSGGTWPQQAKLTASDAAALDYFGWSVAIDGDTAIVGAPVQDYTIGAAYVYTRSNGVWTQQAQLLAPDREGGDYFGVSVGISGDTAIVGAWGDYENGHLSGSAYVFVRSGGGWTQQAKLTASDAAPEEYFGWSVAISGDTAVVGAYGDNYGGENSGSAYVFTRTNGIWTQQQKLTASDAEGGDRFGESVAISGDTLVAGARYSSTGSSHNGAAYVFTRSDGVWRQHAKRIASDAAPDDQFGSSVAISTDTMVVGAPLHGDLEYFSGSAYVFTSTLPRGWMMY